MWNEPRITAHPGGFKLEIAGTKGKKVFGDGQLGQPWRANGRNTKE